MRATWSPRWTTRQSQPKLKSLCSLLVENWINLCKIKVTMPHTKGHGVHFPLDLDCAILASKDTHNLIELPFIHGQAAIIFKEFLREH